MNGELISEEEVAEYLPQIYKLCCDHGIPGTFFEITTALAFLFFQKQHEAAGKRSGSNSNSNNETVVVLEAGLGGRLDATNVIPSPVLSIITSVGLDHTKILGNTREEIAIEKAGIFRADTPVIVGSRVPLSTLKQYAREKRIASFQTSHEILGMIDESDQKEILDYDEENSRTAKAAIAVLQQSTRLDLPTEIPTAILEKGTRVRPPCRFEIIENVRQRGNMVVLDVAHNPSAMESLVWKLRHNYMGTNNTTGIRFLVGMSKDKDWRGILEHLWPLVESKCCSKIHLAEAAHGKASPLDELVPDILSLSKTETRGCNVKHIFDYDIIDPSVTAALDRAMKSMPDGELLVVCGSIFLMIEARQVLGIVEPRDSEYLIDTLAGKLPATKAFANNEIHA